MSYEQFWFGDPWIARSYREAYVERRKEENTRDWLQGAYIYNAVSTALANAFRKKGVQAVDYIEEPFRIFPMTEEEKAAKEARENAKMRAMLMQQAAKMRAEKAAREQRNNAENNNP